MRRRGYTPEALRAFCERVGVAKRENVVEVESLEHSVREHLNLTSPRVMAVLRPLRVVIDNYPEDQKEAFEVANNPEDPAAGSRRVPFSRVLYIESDDFREDPPKKFFRLSPGREVRLRGAYFITCVGVTKNETGEVVELRCTYDPASHGGASPDGRKVKSTIHWVSAADAIDAEARLYDRLFLSENPGGAGRDYRDDINPNSLEVLAGIKAEPSLASARAGERYQFERIGYFAVDPDSSPGHLVFNRTVGLRDTWAKIEARASNEV